MRSLILLLSFCLLSVEAVADIETCEHFLLFESQKISIWENVTGRSEKQIRISLGVANNQRTLTGATGTLPAFEIGAVLDGRKSLLSLGEGESDFVHTILKYQKQHQLPLNANAVDMIYRDTLLFAENGLTDEKVVSSFIHEFPDNYHGSYFQNLALHNSNGERLVFDEIVSSHSLIYLLQKRSNRAFKWKASMTHDLELLRNILGSLKKGGVLRMWPAPFDPRTSDPGSGSLYFREVFTQLLNEGSISNHNFVSTEETNQPFGAILLQR